MITFTQNLALTPGATLNVPVGTTVVWFNNDPFKPHGVQATAVTTGKYFGDMAAHSIPYGSMYNVTFDQAGSYDYSTVFQPLVAGKIVVS
jgi:plastocyanin